MYKPEPLRPPDGGCAGQNRCTGRRCRFLGLISLLISTRDNEGIAEMGGAFTLLTGKGEAADGRLVVAPAYPAALPALDGNG